MPLNAETKQKDIQALNQDYADLSEEKKKALIAINELFAAQNISLIRQNDEFKRRVIAEIEAHEDQDYEDNVDLPNIIFDLVSKPSHKASPKELHGAHHAPALPGDYDTKPLSQCPVHMLMTTEHLNAAMPKSAGNIEVLAPIGANPAGWESAQDAMQTALAHGKQVVIPVQQNAHYRLLIAKPVAGQPVQVELFDSMGKDHADNAKELVNDFFEGVNIAIVSTEPAPLADGTSCLQTDGYSCGDYVAARANQLMAENKLDHNAPLVAALIEHGNKDDALRLVTRGSLDEVKVEVKVEVKQATTLVTEKEKEVFQSAVAAFTSKDSKPMSEEVTENYKTALEALISGRDSIFTKADKAEEKVKANVKAGINELEGLSDEEYAAIEQAKEFSKAGFGK